MGILIGADFVPTESNSIWFEEAKIEKLIEEKLYYIIKNADYKIFNLELPLTNVYEPIKKCGPNLMANTNTINGYRKLGVNLFTLANNHILDQGIKGVLSTKDVLEKAGIQYIGLESDSIPDNSFCTFAYNGKKIGVYACAEHEFSTLNIWDIRANPYDEMKTSERIEALKSICDYVIVLYHGGKEYYRYPSPKLQKICQGIVQSGADLVICQHSHCIGCEEKYNNSTILYGQGNFLFDLSNNEFCKTGLLINIDSSLEISYIPIVKKDETVSLASDTESYEIMREFYRRSEQIKNGAFVENNYNEFSNEMLETYLWALSGKESVLFKIINRITFGKLRKWHLERKYNDEIIKKIYNFMICEAHNELLTNGLENKIYD